jgi:hypothetical protein
MIDFRWLWDSLCDVLRWQLANPGGEDGSEVPIAGRRVWSIFLELNATRTVGMAVNPIGEIESWSRLRREPVRPFEVTMLRAPDAAYLEAARAERDPGPQKVSGRPLTPVLFDALFGRVSRPTYATPHATVRLRRGSLWFPKKE